MHPHYVFNNVVKGQSMRVFRLNPTEAGYEQELMDLRTRFMERKYNPTEVNRIFRETNSLRTSRAHPYFSNGYNAECTVQDSRVHLLKVPLFTSDISVIKEVILKHWGTLLLDENIREIVGDTPRFLFKNKRNLKRMLCYQSCTNTEPDNTQIDNHTKPCNRCNQYEYIDTRRNFIHPFTKQEFIINVPADCQTEHVVYLARCTACEAFYIGKTNRKLRERIREHAFDVRIGSESSALTKHNIKSGPTHKFKFTVLQKINPSIRGGDLESYTEECELSVTGSLVCSPCRPGSHANETGSRACSPCAAGYNASYEGALSCEPCPQGSFSNVTGSLVCSPCWPGSHANETGSRACSPCAAGYNASSEGALSCEPCPQGTFSNVTGSLVCSACQPGSHANETGSRACSPCAAGFSVPHQGAALCEPCHPGSFSPHSGATSCDFCPKGLFSNHIGSSTCLPCKPGSFSDETGSIACKQCAAGFFASEQGASSCEPCLPGFFCSTYSCIYCTPCPSGAEAVRQASTYCELCHRGSYKGLNDSACRNCNAGDYQTWRGQDNCIKCPQEYYCPSPDVSPVLCPEDAFCPPGSTAPQYCMETFFHKSGNKCVVSPLTVVLLVTFAALIILVIVCLVQKRRQNYTPREVTSQSQLIPRSRTPDRQYGSTWHAEPVYAGW
ncbi:latent-transforming growth factor beta-binding protein 2-like [Protopterus annectens]|uniref:latent-transforming growth factor beta-binding protein 2-like n=1 Tax=Protopterus annectens TaxID=7888 RepID=UPI001CF9D4D1|nr:latent-transforming growth factor beta-binding protein 2-like [Protopterus annectens]